MFKELIKHPAIHVFMIPFMYVLYYVYEIGTLTYYNVPKSFYIFDLSRCVSFVITTTLFGIIIFYTVKIVNHKFGTLIDMKRVHPKQTSNLKVYVVIIIILCLIIGLLLGVPAEHKIGDKNVRTLTYISIAAAVVFFLLYLYTLNTTVKLNLLDNDKFKEFRGYLSPVVLYSVTVFLTLSFIYILGYISALSNKHVYSIDERKDVYGILIRSETIITKNFKNGKLGNSIQVIDIKNKVIKQIKLQEIEQKGVPLNK